MAKLGTYYGLCPLIDQKSLLGVSEDEADGYLIVTLGKNMAIKYKLSDQKQIHSWSTKDHLTSCIIYDKGLNQYVAVFNNSYIRLFGSDCENLDRIKKNKFQTQIHSLISTNGETLVVFKNGTISSLKYALDNRKTATCDSVLDQDDAIESCSAITFEDRVIVNFLVKNKHDELLFVAVFLKPDKETEDIQNVISIKLNRSSVALTGYLLIINDDTLELLTLWSDGKLYSMPMRKETEFPGKMLSVIESLSCQQKVCMLALSSTYIALYGADRDQEGSSLVIYNIQFQVTQCRQAFKLYTIGSKFYLLQNNILLTVGNHLAVVPYQLATEQLAALVGSHHLSVNYEDPDISVVTEVEVSDWDETKVNSSIKYIPDQLKTQVTNLLNEGYSEILICKEIIPDLIEKQNINQLMSAVRYFTEIPEEMIASLLVFVLTANNKLFKNKKLTNIKENQLEPLQRCELLNEILNLKFNDVLLMPHLRTQLSFSLTLQLLNYLRILLDDNELSLDHNNSVESECKIIEWGSLLLDTHYQKFILSKDVDVINTLKSFQQIINFEIMTVNECKQILPTLDFIKMGKSLNRTQQNISKWYSVEQTVLY